MKNGEREHRETANGKWRNGNGRGEWKEMEKESEEGKGREGKGRGKHFHHEMLNPPVIARVADEFIHFGKFLTLIFESCGATYRRKYEMIRAF